MTEHSERYWEARWRDEAKLTAEAAAFLDRLADRLLVMDHVIGGRLAYEAAADCRAMAQQIKNPAHGPFDQSSGG